MTNGNGTSLVGVLSDVIGGVRESVIGTESMLGDMNALGMQRPLSQINFAAQLAEGGGIVPSLQTGIKKKTAARKGGGTGSKSKETAPRYRPTPSAPTDAAFEGSEVDEEFFFI